MVKRTRHDIEADILNLCRVPKRKTQIVYGCNLNFRIYKGYIKRLIEKKYLREVGIRFETTKEGLYWLESALTLGIGSMAEVRTNTFV